MNASQAKDGDHAVTRDRRRARRAGRFGPWYVAVPACLFLVFGLMALAVVWRAARIRTDTFFEAGSVPPDAGRQLAHIAELVRRGNETAGLSIYDGYSTAYGRHVEWDPIFYMFAAMAFAEIHQAFPERRVDMADLLTLCARGVARLPSDLPAADIPAFLAARDYTGSPIMGGYVGVVLGLRRIAGGDGLFDAAQVPVARSLAAHLDASLDHCVSEWTSDHATQLYAIWLFDQAHGTDHTVLFDRWQAVMEERFLEARTGLLYSLVSIAPDAPLSAPRGTSLAWTSILLADVMPAFAREQYAAMRRHREWRLMNLSATAEYPRGELLRFGDADSGPLVLGISPAATGFTLCTHKLFGEQAAFNRVFRVVELFGSPQDVNGRKFYARGNAMGDAVFLYAGVARPRPREDSR